MKSPKRSAKSMTGTDLKPGAGLSPKVRVAATTATRTLESQLSDVEHQYETSNTGVSHPEKDPAEPPQLEDAGDSQATLSGKEILWVGDQEWSSSLPLVLQLPRRVRPPVRFLLDDNLEVHKLDKADDTASNLCRLIACGIALHIRDSGVQLKEPGDWRHIPAIGTDDVLINLASMAASLKQADKESRQAEPDKRFRVTKSTIQSKSKSRGAYLKDFAMLLPNGDVITPQAVISRAQTVMKATLAGVLRSRACGETEIAGEFWARDNWSTFRKARNEDRRRRKAKK